MYNCISISNAFVFQYHLRTFSTRRHQGNEKQGIAIIPRKRPFAYDNNNTSLHNALNERVLENHST